MRARSPAHFQRSNDANVKPPTGNPGEIFCPEALAVSAKGYVSVVWQPFQFRSSGTVGNETYVTTNTINSDGSLTAVSGSQVKTASTSANKVAVNFDPGGSFLAVEGDRGIQTYALIRMNDIAPPASVPVVTSFPAPGGASVTVSEALDFWIGHTENDVVSAAEAMRTRSILRANSG